MRGDRWLWLALGAVVVALWWRSKQGQRSDFNRETATLPTIGCVPTLWGISCQ